jgi:hypothetical protein
MKHISTLSLLFLVYPLHQAETDELQCNNETDAFKETRLYNQ